MCNRPGCNVEIPLTFTTLHAISAALHIVQLEAQCGPTISQDPPEENDVYLGEEQEDEGDQGAKGSAHAHTYNLVVTAEVDGHPSHLCRVRCNIMKGTKTMTQLSFLRQNRKLTDKIKVYSVHLKASSCSLTSIYIFQFQLSFLIYVI